LNRFVAQTISGSVAAILARKSSIRATALLAKVTTLVGIVEGLFLAQRDARKSKMNES
jgi:hypothetical protein